MVQTVGGATALRDSFSVLLPILHPSFSFLYCNSILCHRIIDDVPLRSISQVVDRAFLAYKQHMVDTGNKVMYDRSQWPSETGGPVHFLLGIQSINFKVIWEFEGLLFISHSIDTSGGYQVSIGGALSEHCGNSEKDGSKNIVAIVCKNK